MLIARESGLGSRRLGRWLCRGRLSWRGRAALDRVSLIVKADDVLSYVNLRGGVENRSALGGRIENYGIAVFARVAVEHIHHFAADAVDDVGLRGVDVFLIFRVHAIEALRKPLALLPQTSFFFLAQLAAAAGKPRLQVIDLLVEVFDLGLAGSKLRLQFRGSHLALRRGNDRLANADDADLSRCGRARRGGRLGPDRCQAQNAGGR